MSIVVFNRQSAEIGRLGRCATIRASIVAISLRIYAMMFRTVEKLTYCYTLQPWYGLCLLLVHRLSHPIQSTLT